MNYMERLQERERRKAVCADLFEDYRQSVLAYAEWMDDFRKRTGRVHPLLPLSHETEAA
jgi:hypothetical protein